MLKKISWVEGKVLSLEVDDGVFSLAQMHVSPYLQFYNIFTRSMVWDDVDLSRAERLFCIPVSDKRIRPMLVAIPDASQVLADTREMPRKMIDANLNFGGGYPFLGGNLISIDVNGESVGAVVLKANLEAGKDDEVIRRYELTNMWVDLDKLRARLRVFFHTGVDWDVHKEKVFPGVAPPAARQVIVI